MNASKQTKSYPVIAMKEEVTFPMTLGKLGIGRESSINALANAQLNGENLVLLVPQVVSKDDELEARPEDLFEYGTLVSIKNVEPTKTNKAFHITFQGVSRIKITKVEMDSTSQSNFSFLRAEGYEVPDSVMLNEHSHEVDEFRRLVAAFLKITPNQDVAIPLASVLSKRNLDLATETNLIAFALPFSIETKRTLLATADVKQRISILTSFLVGLNETEARAKLKSNRELHSEQIKRQQEEMDGNSPHKDLIIKIRSAKLPPDVKKIVDDEFRRLEQVAPASSEYNVIRNYLEWIVALPWKVSSKDLLDVNEAKKILSEDHYGLEKVKRRILEFISVAKFRNSLKGSIICLVGPPGVGKTSLARSIARSINRKYVRISLGGVRDEAEIRGHRRTYVGAMPGKFIQSFKKVGVNNPVILLDEIDKMTSSNTGDPSAAMLEVLDPEQNMSFQDHYLDMPFDLSNSLFIATANVIEDIPGPLRDRMEIIYVGAYTASEKTHIANNHLVPKQIKEHGLTPQQVLFDKLAVQKIVSDYTREAGVRELQRMIAAVCRSAAQELLENNLVMVEITTEKVEEYLGTERYHHETYLPQNEVGVVTGMAWTPVGGDVLFVEANKMPGNGKLILTGSLGNVMKESAQIALSYIRSNQAKLGVKFNFDEHDIHIHFPSGAIPKDGPSAGVTLTTAIVSLLKDTEVNSRVSMTGEVSLRGKVLPVGGIKEKVIAAHRAGIKEIILPKSNKDSIDEIPEEVKKDLTFHFVEEVSQVLDIALVKRTLIDVVEPTAPI